MKFQESQEKMLSNKKVKRSESEEEKVFSNKKVKRSVAIEKSMPNELVEDILTRLPLKSLLRFESVSKYFSSLIRSPSFVPKQFHRPSSSSGFDHAIVLASRTYTRARRRELTCDIFFRESPDHNLVNWNHTSPCSLIREGTFPSIAGHCNGLICLCYYRTGCYPYRKPAENRYSVYGLWNPIRREFKILPLPPSNNLSHHRRDGFGYDPKSRDYKIVRLASQYHPQRDSRVEVYSLRTNSWRRVANPLSGFSNPKKLPPENCSYGEESACLGEFCYWLDADRTGVKILSFDFSKEVFRVMYLPEQVSLFPFTSPQYQHITMKVTVWNESIAVSSSIDNKRQIRIWLLDSPNLEHFNSSLSVKEEFTVNLRHCLLNNLELLWNAEVIVKLRGESDHTVAYYDTITQEIKKSLFFETSKRKIEDFHMSGYNKSLVSLFKQRPSL